MSDVTDDELKSVAEAMKAMLALAEPFLRNWYFEIGEGVTAQQLLHFSENVALAVNGAVNTVRLRYDPSTGEVSADRIIRNSFKV